MVQRPRPDLRGGRSNAHSYRNSGGYGEIRIPTVTGSRGWATTRGHPAVNSRSIVEVFRPILCDRSQRSITLPRSP